MKKFLICTTAIALLPASAWAQDAEESDDGVIYVTAERRAEDVQDVPISIVALSGETLRERGVESLADLTTEVPSFSFVDNGNTKFINIRGVGITESAPAATVGVAVHLDGTYIVREITFGDAFFDVASVQVLRGPQGTYSGQNANGGAIFIESARPVIGRAEGYAQATIGDFSRRDLEAAVSVPLGDTLAARFSGRMETRDSYYTNVGPGNGVMDTGSLPQPGDRQALVGRAQLLWQPNASFEARLIHQFSRQESDGTPWQIGVRSDYADPYILRYNDTPYDNNITEYHRTTGTVSWQASDGVEINANLSYQDTTKHITGGDYDRTPVEQSQGFTAIADDSWTGEINALSTGDGPFNWTIGATFLDYDSGGDVYSETGAAIQTRLGRNIFVTNFRNNQALFGELGYQLSDSFEVRVGARYNRDESGYGLLGLYPAGGLDNSGPSFNLPGAGATTTGEEITGRVLVNWNPHPDHLIYGTISRGYKPGGITGLAQVYGAEIVTNWEAGWKGSMLNGALDGSVSVFFMDYDGFQASVQPIPTDPTSTFTDNVDNTRVKGIEAQFSTNIDGFSADIGVSYLDTSFGPLVTTLPAGADGNANPIAVDIDGRRINYAPEFSLTGGVAYEVPLGGGYLTPSVRVSHTSEQYVTFFLLPYHRIDSRTLVDARLTFEPSDDWRITGYVTNLFDEVYTSNASQTTNGVGQFLLGQPREIGVTVGVTF